MFLALSSIEVLNKGSRDESILLSGETLQSPSALDINAELVVTSWKTNLL